MPNRKENNAFYIRVYFSFKTLGNYNVIWKERFKIGCFLYIKRKLLTKGKGADEER